MAEIFNGSVFGGPPGISTTVNYEYARDGANMKYHFWGNTRLSSSGDWYRNNVRVKLYLNGSDIYTKDCKSSSKGWSINWDAGWHTVSNKTSGTTPFYFTVKDTQNSGWCNYTSGTYQLYVAPAYASITRFDVSSVSETQIQFTWGASHACDASEYSIDGSGWIGGNYPTTIIGGLSSNAKHSVRIRVKRTDSQLWTESETKYASTYNWPHCTNIPNFKIGDNATSTYYNPLGRDLYIQLWAHVPQAFVSDIIHIGNVTSYNGFADIADRLYASIPESKSSGYNIDVWYGDHKEVCGSGTYSIKENDSEKPAFDSNYIKNITNSLYADIAGTNKFIKNHNKLSAILTPMIPQKEAHADYYNISSSGLPTITKYYSSSDQSFELGNISANTFNVTAVDKRGLYRSTTVYIDFVDYNNPGVTNAKITRQNGIGTKAVLSFTGVYTNWSGLLKTNSIQSIRYKIGASGTWKSLPSDATLISSGGVWTLNAILNEDFSTTSQYDLYLEINDLLETVVLGAYTISTADAFIWKDLANKRIGINKKPNETLDVAGDINADNALYINGVKMIWYE